MPIVGLTDQSRPPRIAKIRLGAKDGGKGFPRAWDHFNFVDAPELEQIFGPDAKALTDVYLPSDDEEVFAPTFLKAYRKSGLFCKSDGVEAMRVNVGLGDDGKPLDPQGAAIAQTLSPPAAVGSWFPMPCPYQDCTFFQRKLCKPVMRLLFMILHPKLPKLGLYEIATSSEIGIVDVLSYTRYVKRMRALNGGPESLMGVPFNLKLVPRQVQPDGKAKTVYVLALEFPGGWDQLAQSKLGGVSRTPFLLTAAPDESAPPDDLYEGGGGVLEDQLSPTNSAAAKLSRRRAVVDAPQPQAPPPAAEAAPVVDAPVDLGSIGLEEELVKVGRQLGFTDMRIRVEIRKTPAENLPDLLQEWDDMLAAARSTTKKAPPQSPAPETEFDGGPNNQEVLDRLNAPQPRPTAAKSARPGLPRRLV